MGCGTSDGVSEVGVGEGRSKGGGIREGREGCGIGVEGGMEGQMSRGSREGGM